MKINEPQTLVGTKLEGAIAEYLVPSPWIAYPTTAKLWWLTLEQQIQCLSSIKVLLSVPLTRKIFLLLEICLSYHTTS